MINLILIVTYSEMYFLTYFFIIHCYEGPEGSHRKTWPNVQKWMFFFLFEKHSVVGSLNFKFEHATYVV